MSIVGRSDRLTPPMLPPLVPPYDISVPSIPIAETQVDRTPHLTSPTSVLSAARLRYLSSGHRRAHACAEKGAHLKVWLLISSPSCPVSLDIALHFAIFSTPPHLLAISRRPTRLLAEVAALMLACYDAERGREKKMRSREEEAPTCH